MARRALLVMLGAVLAGGRSLTQEGSGGGQGTARLGRGDQQVLTADNAAAVTDSVAEPWKVESDGRATHAVESKVSIRSRST